jgi:hypothetical protein
MAAMGALFALSLGWNGAAADAGVHTDDPLAQRLGHPATGQTLPALRRQATVGTSELVGARANEGALQLFLCMACAVPLWTRRRRVIVRSVSPARPAILRRRHSIALRGPPVVPVF